jgi:hypothetical protein
MGAFSAMPPGRIAAPEAVVIVDIDIMLIKDFS